MIAYLAQYDNLDESEDISPINEEEYKEDFDHHDLIGEEAINNPEQPVAADYEDSIVDEPVIDPDHEEEIYEPP